MKNILIDMIQEPPAYDENLTGLKKAFPSLIDLALEAVHMGADKQAERLLDLRKFLIKHFKNIEGCEYAEKESNEYLYKTQNPRTLG